MMKTYLLGTATKVLALEGEPLLNFVSSGILN